MTDSIDLPPLHSLPHSAAQISRAALAHSEVSKSFETVKVPADAPEEISEWAGGAATLVAALLARLDRLTKVPPFSLIALGRYPGSNTRREALPIAEDQSNNRITGQPSVAPALAGAARTCARKLSGEADARRNWSDTPPLDFAACRLRFPHVTTELAVIPLRSSGGESENLEQRT